MGTVDFRVGGKIFATLGYPDASFGMVQLTPDRQALLVETTPKMFVPVAGGWGRRGSTNVRLAAADPATLTNALRIAWENVARKTSAKREAALVKTSAAPKRSLGDTDRPFARAVKAAKATKLPGIEKGTSYGTPSLTVRGKFMMRVKDPDTLVFRCTMEEK